MDSSTGYRRFKRWGSKAAAVVAAGAMAAMMVPATALAHYDYNNTSGKAVMTGETGDSWGSGTLKKSVPADGTVSYTGIVHSDLSHYTSYGLTTTIKYDSQGLITGIDLTSGSDTFAGSWGYLNVAKSPITVEGYLPDGVDFEAVANADGTYTPKLTGAAAYGTYKVNSYAAYSATKTDADEVDGGVSYDEATNKITINDSSVNLVKVSYQIGVEKIYFNTYFSVGDADAKETADEYVDTIPATTWDATPDLTGNMGSTNRNRWAAIMATVYAQRMLQSWGAYLADDSLAGEVDDLDIISGATKTSEPFVEALNRSVTDGYVKGVSENVKITIDGDDIDIDSDPMDKSTVTVNDAGQYVLSNDFPVGEDMTDVHSVTLDSIQVYETGNQPTTAEMMKISKGQSSAEPVATYTPESLGLNPVTTTRTDRKTGQQVTSTSYSWDDFSTDLISFDYTSGSTQRAITALDSKVNVVSLTFTLGHATITIAYDLAQMKAAGDVKAQISALTTESSSSEVSAARKAYNALSTDVRGFVNNVSALEDAEAAVAAKDLGNATVKLSKGSYTYNGKAQKPSVTVTLGGKTLVQGTDYKVSYANNVKAGKATVTVSALGSTYTGRGTKTFTIAKASQSIKAKASAKKVSTGGASKLKKAKSVKPLKVSGAKGKVTYKKASGSSKLSIDKKTGKVTVKKGAKKGSYTAKIKVSAASTANYQAASKTVKVTVKVVK